MPTVLRSGPYRFFFYSSDREEPVHVHIARDTCHAKYWVDPPRLDESTGFGRKELGILEGLVRQHADAIRKAWNDHFIG